MSRQLSINIPDELLTQLSRLAAATDRPVEDVVLATLSDSVPRPPTDLPADIRAQLSALETLSDEELMEVVNSVLSPIEAAREYEPGDCSDQLALRKAYAAVLLRWRGTRVDAPTEFTT